MDNRREYKKLFRHREIKRFFFSKDASYEKYLSCRRADFVDVVDSPFNPTIDFDTRLGVGNSGLFGLQIAIGVLGYREVYLLGCDANYEEQVPDVKIVDGVYKSTGNGDVNHFRSDYYGKGTTYNKPGGMKWHYQAWKCFYEKYLETRLLNVSVYNLSPVSKLTFFKKAKFSVVTKKLANRLRSDS